MMRQPTTYSTWTISCPSVEDAESLGQWLESRIELDRVVTDTVRTAAGGVAQSRNVEHRLGDYFADIRMQRDARANAALVRLVFQRRPDAGRFWRDLMVTIVQEIESAHPTASVALESKGDTEPIVPARQTS